ncbi:MAG: hypothetical protein RL173_2859 [Fibrobacterota bacterium]
MVHVEIPKSFIHITEKCRRKVNRSFPPMTTRFVSCCRQLIIYISRRWDINMIVAKSGKLAACISIIRRSNRKASCPIPFADRVIAVIKVRRASLQHHVRLIAFDSDPIEEIDSHPNMICIQIIPSAGEIFPAILFKIRFTASRLINADIPVSPGRSNHFIGVLAIFRRARQIPIHHNCS